MIPNKWKNPINKWLNLGLYLVVCFLFGTGIVMWLRLPPGQGRRHRGGRGDGEGPRELLGLDRHEWGDWHTYAALALVALTVVHLAMNWAWMMKIAGGRHRWRLIAGLAAGAVIIGFFALYPLG